MIDDFYSLAINLANESTTSSSSSAAAAAAVVATRLKRHRDRCVFVSTVHFHLKYDIDWSIDQIHNER